MTEGPTPASGQPSPWARPAPGQAPADVGLTSPPEVLASLSAGAALSAGPSAGTLPGPTSSAVAPSGLHVVNRGRAPLDAGGPDTAGHPRVVAERHPADPDEASSSKAWAVLALGVVGVLFMFCGGGLVPGLAGLALVRPARAEITAAAGFLTGRRALRAGEILSWIAVAVSAIVIVMVVIGLLIGSVGDGPQYDENVN